MVVGVVSMIHACDAEDRTELLNSTEYTLAPEMELTGVADQLKVPFTVV